MNYISQKEVVCLFFEFFESLHLLITAKGMFLLFIKKYISSFLVS